MQTFTIHSLSIGVPYEKSHRRMGKTALCAYGISA